LVNVGKKLLEMLSRPDVRIVTAVVSAVRAVASIVASKSTSIAGSIASSVTSKASIASKASIRFGRGKRTWQSDGGGDENGEKHDDGEKLHFDD
jgi:hypothetical protein